MFACMTAPFVAHQSRGGAVSIRRCSLESVCAFAQILFAISQTSVRFDNASRVNRLIPKLGEISAKKCGNRDG
jgi:hypothetical protein